MWCVASCSSQSRSADISGFSGFVIALIVSDLSASGFSCCLFAFSAACAVPNALSNVWKVVEPTPGVCRSCSQLSRKSCCLLFTAVLAVSVLFVFILEYYCINLTLKTVFFNCVIQRLYNVSRLWAWRINVVVIMNDTFRLQCDGITYTIKGFEDHQ